MIELLGLLLVIQGAGGLINRLAGSSNPSWFVQLHVLPPPLHIAASAVLLAAGAGVLFAERARKRRRDQL
ncbi:hypothetical protein VSH64_02290 [Amycolatopsis rhabdoformis]|uniref:Uncharacterized protein n=1 Tax=Amycolatopsis rhabdoformis TaxID=1448059 RepID=A0ABZ1I929_9PSEU|nr:hypothetical protein [Amycolatopsis rhabdoformis]WSE30961.1 hypothetical protein VSH64_02290 [Amycolatopsis rhabdoformis]